MAVHPCFIVGPKEDAKRVSDSLQKGILGKVAKSIPKAEEKPTDGDSVRKSTITKPKPKPKPEPKAKKPKMKPKTKRKAKPRG